MNIESLMSMQDFVDRYCKGKVKVLDVGSCDLGTSENNRNLSKDWEYIGADVAGGMNVNVVLEDPYKWDMFKDGEFDCVISSNTFEHIEYPWLTIKEIARVLKPNGYVCIITPFVCPSHGYPVDTYRYNEDGMKALAKWAGLEVIQSTVFGWFWNPEIPCGSTRLIARKNATIS